VDDDWLAELNLWEGDLLFIPWLERKEFFSAKFEYADGELRSYDVNFYGGELRSSQGSE
jgi:8-oxo-dGTP diphosphatase